MHEKILITGANGKLGSVLTQSLELIYGKENVMASDLRLLDHFDGVMYLSMQSMQNTWKEWCVSIM